jgi:SAM-dependent methyltransferase
MLAEFNRSPHLDIRGAEYSQAAIDLAHPLVKERLARCDLQGEVPLPWGGGFQVITCMEVLEHLPDDTTALGHIARALEPGGRLFISVPAWQSNWGPQDEAAGHVRRYEPALLRARIEQAGLRLKRMKCWGGPLAWLYLRAADVIGPQTVMSIRPQGAAGLAASGIYHILKIDDLLPLPRAPQLLALAEKSG